jgi:hypothetical protein
MCRIALYGMWRTREWPHKPMPGVPGEACFLIQETSAVLNLHSSVSASSRVLYYAASPRLCTPSLFLESQFDATVDAHGSFERAVFLRIFGSV